MLSSLRGRRAEGNVTLLLAYEGAFLAAKRRFHGPLLALGLASAFVGLAGVPSSAQDAGAGRPQACARLEGQLTALDRGAGDSRADQARQLESAAGKQQAEIDKMNVQSQRLGCGGGGFFLFGGLQSPQCDQLNAQIQRARSNLDRLLASAQRVQGSGSDRDEQRRAILIALAQNGCGPQSRTASAPAHPRGFFESLFGSPDSAPPAGGEDLGPPPEAPKSSTVKTLCVRTCDGYYFPISNAATSSKLPSDERTCQRLCPAAEVALYSMRSSEDVKSAVSTSGQPYTALPNAFRYRQEYNPSCSCKKPGETWASALAGLDDTTVERGDIIVTEEQSKALAQPKSAEAPAASEPSKSRAKKKNGKAAAE